MLAHQRLRVAFDIWKGATRDKQIEKWAPIIDTCYEVSNFGKVRNLRSGKILQGTVRKSGYVQVNLPTSYLVHRLVLEAFLDPSLRKREVDHIDHNPVNNHITNLRYTTSSENQMNRSVQSNNTSGVTGVTFRQKDRLWRARIKINKTCHYLGEFKNKEDAIAARIKASNLLFGDFNHVSQKIMDK